MTYLKVADHFEVAFNGRRRVRPAPVPDSTPGHASDYAEPGEFIAAEAAQSRHTQDGPDAELARVAAEYDAWAADDNAPKSPFVERKPDEV